MSPATQERLSEVWLAEFDTLRDHIRGQVETYELAEDITMQAFAELGEHMERILPKRDPSPGAWLWKAAKHRLIDHKRAIKANPPALPLLEDTDESFVRYRPYDAPFAVTFDQAVRDLPKPERDAFILTELRGATVREAADILGTSKDTVDRRAKLATTLIREELLADAA